MLFLEGLVGLQRKFNSDECSIYYCGQESLRRNAVLGCDLKSSRMILVHFQDKPFNIAVIQVYAPTTDA